MNNNCCIISHNFNVLFIANNRIHGNTGRKPPQALSRDELNRVLSFIKNYVEIHAILLPGRIPGLKDYEKVKLLPCSFTWNMQSPVRR